MAAERKSSRVEAVKIASTLAQQIDSSFSTVANPELIAVGMMRDLGATDLGAGEGKTRTIANKPVDDNDPKLVAARKTGSLERVIRARREQASASQREQTIESGKPGQLKTIYDFSGYDDDEIGLIDPATLTSSSRDAYVEELDQRMASGGSFAEAQAWEVQEGEDVQTFDIDDADPWEGDVI